MIKLNYINTIAMSLFGFSNSFLFPLIALAIDPENRSSENIYHLDLFSVLSFALAIASLLISFFMAWLSWEFHKMATADSNTTNQALTKIQDMSQTIQSNMMDIINKAIEHWTNNDLNGRVEDKSFELIKKVEEISSKIDILAKSKSNGEDITSNLNEVTKEMRGQLKQIHELTQETNAKSAIISVFDKNKFDRISKKMET